MIHILKTTLPLMATVQKPTQADIDKLAAVEDEFDIAQISFDYHEFSGWDLSHYDYRTMITQCEALGHIDVAKISLETLEELAVKFEAECLESLSDIEDYDGNVED